MNRVGIKDFIIKKLQTQKESEGNKGVNGSELKVCQIRNFWQNVKSRKEIKVKREEMKGFLDYLNPRSTHGKNMPNKDVKGLE